jgi:hypothetical protein
MFEHVFIKKERNTMMQLRENSRSAELQSTTKVVARDQAQNKKARKNGGRENTLKPPKTKRMTLNNSTCY